MVLATLSTLFSTVGTAANTAKTFKELLTNKKGEVRLLLEELKRDSTLSWLVVNREVEARKVIPQLSTKAYDRLLEEGYNFNNLASPKKRIVRGDARFEDSDLSSFIGRDVANLIEGIYDRINQMKIILEVDPDNKHIDWNRRVINLHKRILLLTFHLKGWTNR
jgi:hypothetical protein